MLNDSKVKELKSTDQYEPTANILEAADEAKALSKNKFNSEYDTINQSSRKNSTRAIIMDQMSFN